MFRATSTASCSSLERSTLARGSGTDLRRTHHRVRRQPLTRSTKQPVRLASPRIGRTCSTAARTREAAKIATRE
jgi:hypothetical protein